MKYQSLNIHNVIVYKVTFKMGLPYKTLGGLRI